MSRCLRCGAGNEWIEPMGGQTRELGNADRAAVREFVRAARAALILVRPGLRFDNALNALPAWAKEEK